MKKILFIANSNSVHSHRWIEYFANKDTLDIYWLSPVKSDYKIHKNIKYIELNFKKPIKLFLEIFALMRDSFDIVHVHYLGWNAVLGQLFFSSKIVCTAWGSDVLINSQNLIKKYFIRKICNQSQLITCDANHIVDKLGDLGINKKKCKIIYFGIDCDVFKNIRQPFENLENNQVTIGSIRNHFPIYDIPTLLLAMEIVINHHPNIMIKIAGTGPETSRLRDLSRSLKISDNVKFLGGLKKDELNTFYNSIDIYVSTSISDAGIASSTAEAMLCARPVVITNVAENELWMDNGNNGYLFTSGDYRALAKIIVQILSKRNEAKRIGNSARAKILKNNNKSVEMEKMYAAYKEII